jgi:hypothetical protein
LTSAAQSPRPKGRVGQQGERALLGLVSNNNCIPAAAALTRSHGHTRPLQGAPGLTPLDRQSLLLREHQVRSTLSLRSHVAACCQAMRRASLLCSAAAAAAAPFLCRR